MADDRLLSILRRLGRQQAGELASLLQGEILFDSEYGVGSVFTLALPLEE